VIDTGSALTFRGELFLHVGDLANAEVDARTLLELSTGYGWPLGEQFGVAHLGAVLVERGELDAADELLGDGAVPDVYGGLWVLLDRGRLRHAQGRLEEAAAELRECGRRALAIDHYNPAVIPWRSQLAQVLAELGETTEARWLASDELGRAHALGGRRALGIALCAAAAVGDDRIGLLREATTVLDASDARLECARAHAALGEALRRAGEAEAEAELRLAAELARACGARALEAQALGAQPREPALTPSERRVAELAAAGQQDREIAEALFVATATVEEQLRSVYRKLGVESRAQLGRAL
jgi:DNA-binding CsgD family transcriptional regulator